MKVEAAGPLAGEEWDRRREAKYTRLGLVFRSEHHCVRSVNFNM